MSKVHTSKFVLAMLALLVITGMLQAQAPPASPLTATPSPVALSFTKPLTAGPTANVKFTVASGTQAFVVDPATVPFWLTLGATSGTASVAGVTITFDASTNAASLGAGNYSASVHVRADGFADLLVPVSIVVNDPASTLTVTATNAITFNWTPGTAVPTKILTAVSSDQPIAFSVTTSVAGGNPTTPNWISVNHASGIAYTFGTPITVSFLPDVFVNANVGDVLIGTVTFTAGATVINETYHITVMEPAATLTSIFPNQTPPQGAGHLTVIVTGTGFGTAGGYAGNPTTVSITYGAFGPTDLTTITGGAVNAVNSTTLILTIPFQDATPNPILAAGPVGISIQNGALGSPVTATLTVTTNPIIYTVTDGASLVEPAPGAAPKLAPYEMITIFGDNFGPAGNFSNTLDGFSRYLDPATYSVGNTLAVTFYKQGAIAPAQKIADAYILFATGKQINALVPSGVTAAGITQLQIVVTSAGLNNSTTPYAATPIAQNPGVFTTASTGQGQGAILLSNYTVNSSASNLTKAAKGSTVLIYVSGMGAPDSTAPNTVSAKAAAFPASCIAAASGANNYMATINALGVPPAPLWTTVDGAVILSSQIKAGHFAPCFAKTGEVTVSIGGKNAAVTYAGWVADSVAGLYQVNATVPTTAASGNAVPVVVTVNGVNSQAGVTMAIQ